MIVSELMEILKDIKQQDSLVNISASRHGYALTISRPPFKTPSLGTLSWGIDTLIPIPELKAEIK